MRNDYFNKFIPWVIVGIFFIVGILYQFSVIAMHYIFGIVSYIIFILAFLISIIKNIKFPYKRIISFFVSIITLMLVFVFHFITCYKPFTYDVKNIGDGLEITGYTYNIFNDYGDYRIEIPSKIRGNEVKSIGEYAFYGSNHFDDLVIPEGVEVINGWAFAHATYKSLVLPDSLKRIEHFAFAQIDFNVDCVTIPNNVEYVGYSAFQITSLVIIVLNDSLYKDWEVGWCLPNLGIYYNPVDIQQINGISYVLHSNNTATVALIDKNVKKVEILEKLIYNDEEYIVKTIGSNSGYKCLFEEINIPMTISKIECNAFYENEKVKEIFIPQNVLYIGFDAFEKCPNLIISVEHEIMPNGWSSNWTNNEVIWGTDKKEKAERT